MKRLHLLAVILGAVLLAGGVLAASLPPLIGHVIAAATAATHKSADTVAVRSSPTNASQHAARNHDLNTDEESAHAIEPDEFSDRLAQSFHVTNLDAAINVCVDVKARTSSQTCVTACAASTITCGVTDSATNGRVIFPEKAYGIAITGKDCLCAVAASGTPVINVEQVNRIP